MTRISQLAGLALLLCCISKSANAAIPVIDNTNLNQHSQSQSHTNKIKDSQKSTVGNTSGVDCAVHTGDKKSNAKDNSSSPDKSGAGNALKQYGGAPLTGGGATQSTDAAGRDQTGQVAGQQDASSQDARSGEETLQGLAGQIGSSQTIKGAYDQNSVIAIQNGMELNSVIRIANAWAQAINTMNMMNVAQTSATATATSSTSPNRCVAGTMGQGTDAQPCKTKACETVELSQTPQPACVEVRYHDTYNNVVTYLMTIEDAVDFKDNGLVLN